MAQRAGCDTARGLAQPCFDALNGRGRVLLSRSNARQRRPNDGRCTDVAPAANGVAPPTIGILVTHEPARARAHDAIQSVALGVPVAHGDLHRQYGGASRQRAAGEVAIPVIRSGSAIEQPLSKRANRAGECRRVDPSHDGPRLRCPSASSA